MLERLNQTVFSAALNNKFVIRLSPSAAFDAELVEVTDLGSTPTHEQFSLIFRCRSGSILPQQIYPVEHEEIGSIEIFLVPVRKDAEGVYYEAIFNRSRT